MPSTSVCLSELTGNVDVDEFVRLLAVRIMIYFAKADKNGFEGELLEAVQSRLEYLNEKVKIYDDALVEVLHTGTFEGINSFGHAKIRQIDGSLLEVMHGRMRRSAK